VSPNEVEHGERVAELARRADDIVNELDVVVKQMAELLRRRDEPAG
jgi:hypothetical protein